MRNYLPYKNQLSVDNGEWSVEPVEIKAGFVVVPLYGLRIWSLMVKHPEGRDICPIEYASSSNEIAYVPPYLSPLPRKTTNNPLSNEAKALRLLFNC